MEIMTIVSGSKLSSEALHQNHAMVFIEMLESNIRSKSQYAKNRF